MVEVCVFRGPKLRGQGCYYSKSTYVLFVTNSSLILLHFKPIHLALIWIYELIWTMNKTVKPMITFSQVWLSQNFISSQSKDAIAMSISSLQLGRQFLGKWKWTTSIVNSNLINEWDCQTKCIFQPRQILLWLSQIVIFSQAKSANKYLYYSPQQRWYLIHVF